MQLLTSAQLQTLTDWFLPERPGPLIGMHIIRIGNGVCFADRFPNPRALLADAGDNYALHGDPDFLPEAELATHAGELIEAPAAFLPLLRRTFASVRPWNRVIYSLEKHQFSPVQETPTPLILESGERVTFRRLRATDAYQIQGLSREFTWISCTWNGPKGLAASGYAWGAFITLPQNSTQSSVALDKLAALACSFFVGDQHEDIGVITEATYRGNGLSGLCVAALCADIFTRGRTPSWSTSDDNLPSLRVAEKLGFRHQRDDLLYIVNMGSSSPF